MKVRPRIKMFVDLCMATALLLLMAYNLIGEAEHEWIGAGMFVLVIIHNILNLNRYRNLLNGRYTAFRIFQLILDVSLIFIILGLMVSGIMLSNYVFDFLPNRGGSSFARTLHMLSAYWGFVLMSLHIGLHTNAMMGAVRKAVRISEPSKLRTILLRITAAVLCIYGVYAFNERQIGSYMLLINQFVFFDFDEPVVFFFADYTAVMGMFACVGHYISGALRKLTKKNLQGKDRKN